MLVSRAVEDMAYERDFTVILCNTDENPAKEAMYLDLMRDELRYLLENVGTAAAQDRAIVGLHRPDHRHGFQSPNRRCPSREIPRQLARVIRLPGGANKGLTCVMIII